MHDEQLTRREREKRRQRREILNAALRLFSDQGFHNISMLEIAVEAEFSVGTLYKFFENKEDLYKALILEKAMEYRRILQKTLARDADPLSVLHEYIRAKSRFIEEGDINILRLLFAESRGASFNIKVGLDNEIRDINDWTLAQLASVMERGMSEGVLRPADPGALAVALDELINAFSICWQEDLRRCPLEQRVQIAWDIFFNGVRAEPGSSDGGPEHGETESA